MASHTGESQAALFSTTLVTSQAGPTEQTLQELSLRWISHMLTTGSQFNILAYPGHTHIPTLPDSTRISRDKPQRHTKYFRSWPTASLQIPARLLSYRL